MHLQCTVFARPNFGLSERPVAELASPLRQADIIKARERCCRLPLRPLGDASAGAEITLAFVSCPLAQLLVIPSGTNNVVPQEGAWSFNPFVRVVLQACDPRDSIGSPPILAQGDTE